MRKPSNYSFVDINTGDVAYCPNCEKVGIQSKLEDLIQDDKPLQADADQWCQCHKCFKKYPIYERKNQGQFSYFKDTVTNPFDSTSTFEAVKKRDIKKYNRLKDYKDKDSI